MEINTFVEDRELSRMLKCEVRSAKFNMKNKVAGLNAMKNEANIGIYKIYIQVYISFAK